MNLLVEFSLNEEEWKAFLYNLARLKVNLILEKIDSLGILDDEKILVINKIIEILK